MKHPIRILSGILACLIVLAGARAAAQAPEKYVQMQRFNDAFPVIIDLWKAHDGDVPCA